MKAVLATPALIDTDLPEPTPGPRDLLVRVEAMAVNPVDSKVRAAMGAGGAPRQLGWDAAGVVTAVGAANEPVPTRRRRDVRRRHRPARLPRPSGAGG